MALDVPAGEADMQKGGGFNLQALTVHTLRLSRI